ncbi:acyltransferase family protein [Burkholderia vietnamiensis]|uniref:acyltransferase family protein n=1 Tax=Burkholderia vietnamiensis TaxID=60552 RepID=UPI00264E0CC2|nr:acyltransferase [Burkholderia vietnamiensis]MDN7820728.1 acyltransferase [Burkholderia vietnamiensis]
MGTYRLLLAIAVILSHIGISAYGRNIGIVAVVSFFLLSGYVMTALIERHYSSVSSVPMFIIDRSMRLFPQFLFYSALTLALIYWFHPVSGFISEITPWTAAINLTMLPLNFFRYFPHAQTVPQAWSLGLEAQFYLAFPFILILGLRVPALLLSLLFFLLPFFNVIDPDTWSYRMLPGTLFIFIIGSFIRTNDKKALAILAYVASIVLCAVSMTNQTINAPLFEVTFGVVIGVPVVISLKKFEFGTFDELAGNLSYGAYLNHFFTMWCLQIVKLPRSSHFYTPILLTASLLLAWVSYELVEKRVVAARHRIRKVARQISEDNPSPTISA